MSATNGYRLSGLWLGKMDSGAGWQPFIGMKTKSAGADFLKRNCLLAGARVLFALVHLVLICGCARESVGPAVIRNAYFEDVYFTHYRNGIWLEISSKKGYPFLQDVRVVVDTDGKNRALQYTDWYSDWDGCGIGCGVNYYLIYRGKGLVPRKLWVFRDIDRKCLLYSYTKEELIELKNEAGFSIIDQGAVFLLEKTGMRVVSEEEYEKLKPTIIPHRHDQALCKPEPNWSEYSNYYERMRTKDLNPRGVNIPEAVLQLISLGFFVM